MSGVREHSEQASLGNLAGKYLTLRLENELYGIQVSQVLEIIRPLPITRIPHAEPSIRGVINLRGKVISIQDLRRFLGLGTVEMTALCVIVILEHVDGEGRAWLRGLLVDEVLDVVDVKAEQIDLPPVAAGGGSAEYIRGITTLGEAVFFILDIERALRRVTQTSGA